MPYADSYLDDDENDPSKAPQLAGGSEVYGGGSLNQSTGGNAKGPTSSDQYQNLNSYLDANKDSSFGQDFVGKVQGETDKANQLQGDSANQFKAKSDQGAVTYDEGLTNSAFQDPNAFVADQGNVDKFKKQRDATYQGPNAFSDAQDLYGQTYGQTRKAADTAEAAGTEGGRFALLGNYFGRPDYKQGEKSLDNLLIQGNPQTSQGIEQAKQNAQAAAANFNKENVDLQNYASANRGVTEETRKKTRTGLGIDDQGNLQTNDPNQPPVGAIQQFLAGLDQRITDLNTPPGKGGGDYFSPMGGGGKWATGPVIGSNYGTSITDPFSGQSVNAAPDNSTYGFDPYSQRYGGMDTTPYNRGNVASQDDALRIKALEKLSDLGPIISNINEAGTETGGHRYTFNRGLFDTDVNGSRDTFHGEAQALADSYRQRAVDPYPAYDGRGWYGPNPDGQGNRNQYHLGEDPWADERPNPTALREGYNNDLAALRRRYGVN